MSNLSAGGVLETPLSFHRRNINFKATGGFRIWYPLWLLPFAVLGLSSGTFWRTSLFEITAELSILMYLLVWRWKMRDWEWGVEGPLGPYWSFWTVMTVLTTPWVFDIPLLGPKRREWKDRKRLNNSFWI